MIILAVLIDTAPSPAPTAFSLSFSFSAPSPSAGVTERPTFVSQSLQPNALPPTLTVLPTVAPSFPATTAGALCAFSQVTNIGSKTSAGWNCNSSGEPVVPVCNGSLSNWQGVSCNSRQQVTQLYPSGLNISGTIPAEIGSLADCTSIFLLLNTLTGTLPASLGKLNTSLKELYIAANRLTGTIPASLGNLKQLTSLGLFDNLLSGTIPPELGNMQSLTTLYLGGNRLTGTVPSSLCDITSLSVVSFYNNALTCYAPCLDKIVSKQFGTVPRCSNTTVSY